MELIAVIKYKYDDKKADIQIKIICWSILVAGILSIVSQSIIVGVFLFFILITMIMAFGRPDGIIKILDKENGMFLQIIERNKKEKLAKIAASRFRWSYNFLSSGKGGEAGKNSVTHVNYLFSRVEFELVDGITLTLGRELKQWESIPKDWEYNDLKFPTKKPICITRYDLTKLKKKLEERKIKYL